MQSIYTYIAVVYNIIIFVQIESSPVKEISRVLQEDGRQVFKDDSSYDFRNLITDDGALYVGATNRLYKLNIFNISQKLNEIDFSPDESVSSKCMSYNGVSRLCQNAVRVLQNVNSSRIYVCGTNAFNPTCSYIDKTTFKEIAESRERGKWRCPYSPDASTHSVSINGTLFTATGNAINAKSRGVVSKTLNEADLHTQENDRYVFHEPTFSGAYHIKEENRMHDKVFMFFREFAEEVPTKIFTQTSNPNYRLTYSRVATVCANDHGGKVWVLNDNFATFTKMRIACPSPVASDDMYKIPYHYDEIQGTYLLENKAEPNNPFVYAVFATPREASAASAICVYSLKQIKLMLSTNKYWNRQDNDESNSFFTTFDSKSGPPPDTCVENTRSLSHDRLRFGSNHPVKYGIIQPDSGSAFYQESGKRFQFIVADTISRTELENGESTTNIYIVIYLVSEDGEIKRIVRSNAGNDNSWTLPSLHVFESGYNDDMVLNVIKNGEFLIIGTNKTVVKLPLAACSQYRTCKECISSRDPYCDLDEMTTACINVQSITRSKRSLKGEKDMNQETLQGFCPGENSNAVDNHREEELEQIITELSLNATQLRNEISSQKDLVRQLRRENFRINTNYTQCEKNTDILHQNLENAAKRLESHASAQRIAIQLYKDTVYSLNDCNKRADDLLINYELMRRRFSSEMARRIKLGKTIIKQKKDYRLTKSELESCQNKLVKKSANPACNDDYDDEEDIQIILRDPTSASAQQNATSFEECMTENLSLRSSLGVFEERNTNLSQTLKHMEAVHVADVQNLQRLRWLHRKNGRRGTQKCENKNWFVYQNTRRMFLLHSGRGTFEEAKSICEGEGGTIATFHDEEEMRYVHNVLRAFEPSRHFWIGLTKFRNKTMIWEDGKFLQAGDVERFPQSQSRRVSNSYFDQVVKKVVTDNVFVDYESNEIDNADYFNAFTDSKTYCAEVSKFQRWQLIKCDNRRRLLCVKDYPTTGATVLTALQNPSTSSSPSQDNAVIN